MFRLNSNIIWIIFKTLVEITDRPPARPPIRPIDRPTDRQAGSAGSQAGRQADRLTCRQALAGRQEGTCRQARGRIDR